MTDERETGERVPRHERVTVHPTPGPRNSLAHWTRARNPLRIAIQYVVVWLARVSPSLKLRRWLLRRIGVTVGAGVSWGLEATPDVFWPDLITLEDHAIVGYDATILCHEFLQEEYRTGAVVVGERAMIGAGAIVLPGVVIGEGARVAANSLVTRDVPPGETVAGVPARPMGGGGDASQGDVPGADDPLEGDDEATDPAGDGR
ncbi:acyltransferase [Natrialbaceae archaeon GCM10025810]|uniref:acyltransferase n=1 Tax=Halovalidus salilacus TaxID=3075124 RepID=UPI00361C6671